MRTKEKKSVIARSPNVYINVCALKLLEKKRLPLNSSFWVFLDRAERFIASALCLTEPV